MNIRKHNLGKLKKQFSIALIFLLASIISPVVLNAQIGELQNLTNGIAWNTSTELLDMDNDGDLDVLSLRGQNSAVECLLWYENTNQGQDFIAHCIELPENVSLYNIQAADVTNDGWVDLINSNVTFVHNGDPDNISFTIIDNTISHNDFIIGDIDGDNDLDLITTSFSNPNKVYLNNALDGTLDVLEGYTPGLEGNYPEAIFIDMDNDNDLDIVSVFITQESNESYVELTLLWYENTNGLGQFDEYEIVYEELEIPLALSQSFYIEVGDFNGDNSIDILLSQETAVTLFTHLNDTWEANEIDEDVEHGDLEAADFDGDGDLDFIIGGGSVSGLQSWFENINNAGTFEKHDFQDSLNTNSPKHYYSADFDGDGDIDLCFMTAFNNATNYHYGMKGIFWFENEINVVGNFTKTNRVSENINGRHQPYFLDLDGDNDKDIIIHGQDEKNYFWIENILELDSFSTPSPLTFNEKIVANDMVDLNGDGKADLLGINEDHELIWFPNNSTTFANFGPKTILLSDINETPLVADDLDGDGDIDLAVSSESNFDLYWLEQTTAGIFENHLIYGGSQPFQPVGFIDINSDGLKDVLVKEIISQSSSHLWYFQQNANGSFSLELILEETANQLEIVDIDDDNDEDLIIYNYDGLWMLLNTPNGFEQHQILTSPGNPRKFQVKDVNNDGKKDIITPDWWYKQLANSTQFSQPLTLNNGSANSYGFLGIEDINNDGTEELFFTISSDILAYAELLLHEGSYVEGYVAIDEQEDCLLDPAIDSTGLYGWTVELTMGDTTYFTSTNLNGYYTTFLPDAGDYTASINVSSNHFKSCYNDTLLIDVNPNEVTFLDFPILIEHACPFMQVNLSSGNLRPCIDGFLSISYCNEGAAAAENAMVEILLDDLLNFNIASAPYTTTDSSYIFEVGTVEMQTCDQIIIQVTPDCEDANVGDLVCATAYVTPDSLCAPLNGLWDLSNIVVSGTCENDNVIFEIKNNGTGAMSVPRQFRAHIANDDIIMIVSVDTFQLESNESKVLVLPAMGENLLLEADQDENHPLLNTAAALVTECADFDISFNNFPVGDGDPFAASLCEELTGSYDPNDKRAIPAGFGAANFIDRDWELEYIIRFQNTGNDTAFNVVVLDTIAPELDLSTLRIGAASHDFVWSLNASRELEFTFNNILLPDSTTNLAGSNGHFQFFIKPASDIPYGAVIQNQAAIYFDFNDPIYTNTTNQTIRTPIFASSEHNAVCLGDEYQGMIVSESYVIIDSTFTTEGLYIDYDYVDVILTSPDTTIVEMAIGEFFEGIEILGDTIITTNHISQAGCDSTVINIISTMEVGTNEIEDMDIKIYPQPTTGDVHISWNSNNIKPTEFVVIASDGQVVKIQGIKDRNAEFIKLNLHELPPGVYWLKINSINSFLYKRIVKL